MGVLPGEYRRVWFADLYDCGWDAGQYHYRVCHLLVYRHYSRLDFAVDVGRCRRVGHCRDVLAGVEALRNER